MNLTVPVTLTLADIEAFAKEGPKGLATYPVLKPGQKKTRQHTTTTIIAWAVILLFAIVIFFVFHKSPTPSAVHIHEPSESILQRFGPFGIVFLIVMSVLLSQTLSKKKRAKAAWEKNTDLQQPHTFEITSDGITVRTPTTDSRYSWSHFTHFYEGPVLLLLYNTGKAAQIIPKRAFSTPADAADFADYCRSKISTAPTAFPVITNGPPPTV